MSAGLYDITIEKGATFSVAVTATTDGVTADNLTGASISGKIREYPHSEDVIATFTCTITNAAAGQFTFSMSPATTAAISSQRFDGPQKRVTKYCYDIEIAYPDSRVIRVLEGVASISPEVTR